MGLGGLQSPQRQTPPFPAPPMPPSQLPWDPPAEDGSGLSQTGPQSRRESAPEAALGPDHLLHSQLSASAVLPGRCVLTQSMPLTSLCTDRTRRWGARGPDQTSIFRDRGSCESCGSRDYAVVTLLPLPSSFSLSSLVFPEPEEPEPELVKVRRGQVAAHQELTSPRTEDLSPQGPCVAFLCRDCSGVISLYFNSRYLIY